MNDITISGNYTFDKLKIFITSFVISIAISAAIFYAIDKQTDIPTDIPTDISVDTDIDWTKPPCNPDDLSNDWKEITTSNMKNRRVFRFKDSNIEIAFDKGVPGAPRFKGADHWHRFNPNSTNKRDLYLDRNGNPIGKNSNSSHIKPCK